MIRRANKQDKLIFQKIWNEYFAFDDEGFNDYFFEEEFDRGEHYLIEENNEVITIASLYPLTIKLNNKLIKTSLISGVATLEQYRHRGYMKVLMQKILSLQAYRELFTMIEAYDHHIYESLGFKPIYKRKCLKIKHNNYRCHYPLQEVEAEKLLMVYGQFMKRFNGFKLRQLVDFERLITKAKYENSKFLLVGNESDNYGYCIYKLYDDKVKIEEIIYLNKQALETMLSYFKNQSLIELYVSEAEKLERFIDGECTSYVYGLVRINDYQLLDRLFDGKIKDIDDLFKGPLWFCEDY
ncbi:MAG: GNAT family N-acetyltransferase [Erysipelotrichaceae bacterium]|nr:GNAT family N-acetyltransferase [Erysipelotrichaceae bacterium]